MNRFKLTREQRHEVYKAALEYYVEYSNETDFFGLCWAIHAGDCGIERPDIYDYPAQYPEIFKHAPKFAERKNYWWPVYNREIRISVLKQTIEETKPL